MSFLDQSAEMQTICAGDARVRNWPGQHAVDLSRAVADMPVSSRVPALTQHLLKTAKSLCISGYFFYEHFTVAVHYSCVAAEAALRDWCLQKLPRPIEIQRTKRQEQRSFADRPETSEFFELLRNGWRVVGLSAGFVGRFSELVDFAIEHGGINESERYWWETGADVRNPLAHGSRMLLPPSTAPTLLRRMILNINQLFPDPALLERDAAVRTRLDAEVAAMLAVASDDV